MPAILLLRMAILASPRLPLHRTIIRSKGDKALFHIDTKLLKRKLNAPDNRQQEHIDNNTAVRDMLVGRGIYPEQLPPAEDVKNEYAKV